MNLFTPRKDFESMCLNVWNCFTSRSVLFTQLPTTSIKTVVNFSLFINNKYFENLNHYTTKDKSAIKFPISRFTV